MSDLDDALGARSDGGEICDTLGWFLVLARLRCVLGGVSGSLVIDAVADVPAGYFGNEVPAVGAAPDHGLKPQVKS